MIVSGLSKSSLLFRTSFILCLALILPVSAGCDVVSNQLKHDREGNLEMQDYRDAMASRVDDEDGSDSEVASNGSSIPDLQPYVSQGEYQSKAMPLVSISVNQTVPLRDVLFELAEQAEYNLELDPRIQGAIIFTARERPFDQVIERISEIAGLRYKMEDDFLRVELDLPFQKNYKIDYLSFVRNSSSTVTNDISVVSGDGTDTGSNFTATSETANDFWAELTAGLEQVLSSVPMGNMRTTRDPRITAVDQNPNVQPVAAPDADGNVTVQPPDAVLRVESLPVDEGGEDSASGGAAGGDGESALFSINKQAGLISVFATEATHKKVAEYLNLLRRAMTAQVLIEAKILQVTLNDNYQNGVDWRFVESLLPGPFDFTFFDDVGDLAVSPNTGFSTEESTGVLLGYTGSEFQAVLRALQNFGTIKALASPRLSVLNNQPAVLNVATNEVFFELDIETSEVEGGGRETEIDSTIRNVPVGVLINVLPAIDLDTKTISMAVRPTITAITDRKPDPSVVFAVAEAKLAADAIVSEIPELNVQEIDTVVNLKSGQAIVMGGLLQDRATTTDSGVPVLAEIPMVGAMFKQHADTVQKTELIIFLKATIVDNPNQTIHSTDKDLYRRFSSDRRPLKL
jgi:general secretion pathway protein D